MVIGIPLVGFKCCTFTVLREESYNPFCYFMDTLWSKYYCYKAKDDKTTISALVQKPIENYLLISPLGNSWF